MKKRVFVLVNLVLATFLQADIVQIKESGVKYIKMLEDELKKNLVMQMKADPSGKGALEFCANAAQDITKEVNAKLPKSVLVKRVALKYRNKANKPDIIDEAIMNLYIDKKAKLKEIMMIKTDKAYRVYKPLTVQKVCLKCHGKNVSKELKNYIKKVYPNDLAINFENGDFRGVIVAWIKK